MHGIDEAIVNVERAFPIPGYTNQNPAAYHSLAQVAHHYLSPTSRILDIGSETRRLYFSSSDFGALLCMILMTLGRRRCGDRIP